MKYPDHTGAWSAPLIPPAHHNAPKGTSDEAAKQIAAHTLPLRQRVYAFVLSRGSEGATDREVQAALGLSSDTEVPRRNELVKRGALVHSGRRRLTPSGRPAAVWIAAEYAEHGGPTGKGVSA